MKLLNQKGVALIVFLIIIVSVVGIIGGVLFLKSYKLSFQKVESDKQGINQVKSITPEGIFAIIQPSVVRIGVRLSGMISTPEPLYDPETNNYVPGVRTLTYPISTVLVGTGFVANSKGYIITNAHVVDVSTDTVADLVWAQYSDNLYDTLNQNLPADLNQQEVDNLHQSLLDFISQNGRIDNLEYQIAVFNPDQKEGTYEDFINKGYQAQLKKIGEPYPRLGKDLAIIKIDKEELPALSFGSPGLIRPGSKVFVLGYPVIADLNETGYTQPTFTSGIVSSLKKSSQGDYNVIQIDAVISGGNSGGPVLNEKGEVIGVATFGAVESQGYNFIIPSNFVEEFLDELNVKYTTASN